MQAPCRATTSYPPLPITNRFPILSLQPMQIDTDTFVNWKRMVQVCVRQCWGHTKVVEPSLVRICASKPQALHATAITRAPSNSPILVLRRPMCFVPCTLCRFSQHRTMCRRSLELFTVSATRLLAPCTYTHNLSQVRPVCRFLSSKSSEAHLVPTLTSPQDHGTCFVCSLSLT